MDLCVPSNMDAEYTGTIVRISDPGTVESLWRKLELCSNPSFFTSWSWIGPWTDLIVNNSELFLFSAEANNTVIAICFLTISNITRLKGLMRIKQVTVNEFLNHDCNMIIQYNGMLVERKSARSAWRCLYECLKSWNKNWDELTISSITQEQLDVISDAVPEFLVNIDKTHREWAIDLSPEFGGINTLIKQFKAKSRHQLRQSIKNFEKEVGPITLTAAASTEDALKYFDAMGKLHTKRWEKVGIAGSFANENWVNFHKEIIRNEFRNGSVTLLSIKSGTENIGYLYGHIHNNVAYMQQTGFAHMGKNILKPGYISHLYAMSYYAAKGIKQYNLLPDEATSYKKFFTTPGNPILWVNFQKNNMKLRLEKNIRRIYGFIKGNSVF
jgi:hypothetical protein